MQQHPLEIPEILSLVGSFLPLWVDESTSSRSIVKKVFSPKTLCTCLQVSKLWYKTLLPILWHTYSAKAFKTRIPDPLISQNGHLCRILEMSPYCTGSVNIKLFNCTNLIVAKLQEAKDTESEIKVVSLPINEGESGRQQLLGVPISSKRMVLRNNPQLRELHWEGLPLPPLSLNVDDFNSLRNLEKLWLTCWDCSNGQLDKLLNITAETLRDLTISRIEGLQAKDNSVFSPIPLQQNGDDDQNIALDYTQSERKLPCLKYFESSSRQPISVYLARLFRRCPNLTTLKLTMNSDHIITHLVESLRNHCPKLKHFMVASAVTSGQLVPLFQCRSLSGMVIPQLCTIRITILTLDDNLISGIIQHAATLNELDISWSGGKHIVKDITGIPRLLVECSRLTCFRFTAFRASFSHDLVNILREHKWGCRNLRQLQLSHSATEEDIIQANLDKMTDFQTVLSGTGWEPVLSLCYPPGGLEIIWIWVTKLRRVLDLIKYQNLSKLESLVLNGNSYRYIAIN